MRTPIRAVERREQRVLERLVRYGLAEVVVHAPRGGEDAGRGLKQFIDQLIEQFIMRLVWLFLAQ